MTVETSLSAHGAATAPDLPPLPELSAQNYADLKTYLLPAPSDLAWEAVDWRPTFREAVVEAQKMGKPVLLWAMNGHPLALT
jgi:hypothetical protein